MERVQEPCKPLSGRALGLVLIFLTAIIWVAASFISQLLVNTEEGKPSYNVSPFLLTYLSTSVFTIFLPLVQLKNVLQETRLLRWVQTYGWFQRQKQHPGVTPTDQPSRQKPGPAAIVCRSLCYSYWKQLLHSSCTVSWRCHAALQMVLHVPSCKPISSQDVSASPAGAASGTNHCSSRMQETQRRSSCRWHHHRLNSSSSRQLRLQAA